VIRLAAVGLTIVAIGATLLFLARRRRVASS
jgi:hypothetical protein